MKINELRLGMNSINVTVKVVDVSEPRNVRTKMGYQTKVATATVEDDTGKIPLTLWGKQIDEIGVGDTIEIKEGFISEFRGELQLNVPRKGQIIKVA